MGVWIQAGAKSVNSNMAHIGITSQWFYRGSKCGQPAREAGQGLPYLTVEFPPFSMFLILPS